MGLLPGCGLSSFWPSKGLGHPGTFFPVQVLCSPFRGLLGAAFSNGGEPFLVGEPVGV